MDSFSLITLNILSRKYLLAPGHESGCCFLLQNYVETSWKDAIRYSSRPVHFRKKLEKKSKTSPPSLPFADRVERPDIGKYEGGSHKNTVFFDSFEGCVRIYKVFVIYISYSMIVWEQNFGSSLHRGEIRMGITLMSWSTS